MTVERAPSEIGIALRGFQSALDEFDEAVASLLGLNRTDLRCVDVLSVHEPMTAGELARAAGLTSGAATFMLDRLERAGFIDRRRDEHDRRKVLIELLPAARARAFEVHVPLIKEMRSNVARFSASDLEAVERFFELGRRIYREHAELLRRQADLEAGGAADLAAL